MTTKDTLLNIIVYCRMAKTGIAESSAMIDRICDELRPYCRGELSDMLGNNCRKQA